MAAAPRLSDERTYVPEEAEHAEIVDFARALEERADANAPEPVALLIDGHSLSLPGSVTRALTRVAQAMAEGRAVVVAPVDQTLTTQQAAALLGVSRPTLVRLLDENAIDGATRPRGAHRRVPLRAVLDYQAMLRERQRRALTTMVELDDDAGMFDIDPADLHRIERTQRDPTATPDARQSGT